MRAFRRIAMFDGDPELISMPLSRAMLCTNCERVSNSRQLRCGVCGSDAVLALATVLGREDPAPPEPTPPVAFRVPQAA
jgi:hypothetical protein